MGPKEYQRVHVIKVDVGYSEQKDNATNTNFAVGRKALPKEHVPEVPPSVRSAKAALPRESKDILANSEQGIDGGQE